MTIRFFILQAHYRSTVDFSNEALQASHKGLERLMEAFAQIERVEPTEGGALTEAYAEELTQKCYEALDDDFNSPIVISHLFDACRTINQLVDRKQTITPSGLEALRQTLNVFVHDILGLRTEAQGGSQREEAFSAAVDMLLELRAKAKAAKDWATSDAIRDRLAELGFEVKDTKVPALMNLFSMWMVRLSLAALLAPSYGLQGVWFAMACELAFRGLIFIWRVWRKI